MAELRLGKPEPPRTCSVDLLPAVLKCRVQICFSGSRMRKCTGWISAWRLLNREIELNPKNAQA